MTEKNLDHEKQQEVDTPKFAPQKVKILVQGYGAEICCGSLTKEQYIEKIHLKEKYEQELLKDIKDWLKDPLFSVYSSTILQPPTGM